MANRHRHSIAVEGHCQGVSAGYHTLSLYLASCPWGVGYLDVYTGWNSCRNRVIINELRKETNIGAGMCNQGCVYFPIHSTESQLREIQCVFEFFLRAFTLFVLNISQHLFFWKKYAWEFGNNTL